MSDVVDKKTQEVIADVYYGTLTHRINKNMKYAGTGILVGVALGVGIATLTGKCKFCLGFWGALGGGGIGYLTSKK